MSKYDVVSICNALVDLFYDVKDEDLAKNNLTKGNMHLVERSQQLELLNHLGSEQKDIELGGSAMNAMRTLATLGKKTAFAGMIADDDFGSKISNRMNELKITSNLSTTNKEATGTCIVLVTPDGERTMVTYLGASRLYGTDHIPEEHLKNCSVFHFCGYQWDTDGQKEAIEKSVTIAKESGAKISFDVADPFVVQHHKNDFTQLIEKYADVVFANEEESKLLYDLSPEETAKKIASFGALSVVKLGSKGALIYNNGEKTMVSPVKTQVVDTTAAGDVFAAGFLYGYTSGHSMELCGKYAATLASDVISRYGSRVSSNVVDSIRSM